MKNLIGEVFGRLTVVSLHKGDARRTQWVCRCECGAVKIARATNLVSGGTKSCGCLFLERVTKHGNSATRSTDFQNSPTYTTWATMVQRCTNPNAPTYNLYGGRGISFDPTWADFRNFLNDMGPRQAGTTLDRVDGNGPYDKENCRWATKAQQAQNTSRTRLSFEIAGAIRESSEPASVLAKRYGVHKSTISNVRNNTSWKTDVISAQQ